MINIFVYGLDQFVVGDVSRELTSLVARLYEVEEDEVNFIAPNDMVFHNGVEQTSWRVIVEVRAPEEFDKFQNAAKDLIMHYISTVAVHVEVTFIYYGYHDHFVKLNPEYPHYLTEKDREDDEIYSDEMEEGEDDGQIYTGDMFEGLGDDDFKKN